MRISCYYNQFMLIFFFGIFARAVREYRPGFLLFTILESVKYSFHLQGGAGCIGRELILKI